MSKENICIIFVVNIKKKHVGKKQNKEECVCTERQTEKEEASGRWKNGQTSLKEREKNA